MEWDGPFRKKEFFFVEFFIDRAARGELDSIFNAYFEILNQTVQLKKFL